MNWEREITALQTGCGIYQPSDSLLRVTGDDARSWLNGQLTNDVARVTSERSVYALIVSVKGKIQADAWVYGEEDEGLILAVPAKRETVITTIFDDQIIMEDVEIEHDPRHVLTLCGPTSAVVLTRIGRPGFASSRLGGTGFDLLLPAAEISSVIDAATEAGAVPVSEEGWERTRIGEGIPRFGTDFDERHYPQEAGLKNRAVSFLKGCYVGQEVVCTLENRGRLRRRLVQLSSTEPMSAGDDLTVEGATVGQITSATADGSGYLGLGYVGSRWVSSDLRLELEGGLAHIVSIVGDDPPRR